MALAIGMRRSAGGAPGRFRRSVQHRAKETGGDRRRQEVRKMVEGGGVPIVETREKNEVSAPGRASGALLTLRGISKHFPGVIALDNVDFDLHHGEVHVLFGENGAGKSTLINIVAGTFPPDSGSFTFDGEEITHLTPLRARLIGISPVFQEFSLVPGMTIEENLFLGREQRVKGLLARRSMRTRSTEIMAELGFDLDPTLKVGALSRAHQQMVEIAKAFLTDVRLLILDEPTASLTEGEAAKLFSLTGRLKSSGVGIIYVSHRIREIAEIGDRITVLRDGRKVATVKSSDVSDNELVELMTGRQVSVLFPRISHTPGDKLLEVSHLTLANGVVRDASIYARAGEITGVAGLVGCGKSELIRAIYGLERVSAGEIRIHGRLVAHPTPITSLSRGVCYFPSDRVAEGLALERPVRENASMAALDLPAFAIRGIVRHKAEKRLVQDVVVDRLRVRPPDIERIVAHYSGGNRQKVLLARGLTRDIRVFLFDEPTVGIDVGAKAEVYELLRELVAQGVAIVLVSSELPEILNLGNRVYVMQRSQVVAELTGEELNEQVVLSHYFHVERETPPEKSGGRK
ncbi:MAG: sugar ABC transporter ATP-binding protein [Acetobacteraceae bacterium]